MLLSPNINLLGLVHLTNYDKSYGVFEMDGYYPQFSRRRNENGEFSNYELIVADNSDGKKRMAV